MQLGPEEVALGRTDWDVDYHDLVSCYFLWYFGIFFVFALWIGLADGFESFDGFVSVMTFLGCDYWMERKKGGTGADDDVGLESNEHNDYDTVIREELCVVWSPMGGFDTRFDCTVTRTESA